MAELRVLSGREVCRDTLAEGLTESLAAKTDLEGTESVLRTDLGKVEASRRLLAELACGRDGAPERTLYRVAGERRPPRRERAGAPANFFEFSPCRVVLRIGIMRSDKHYFPSP